MSKGQLGVLHTKSSYAPGKAALPVGAEDTKKLRIEAQIRALEAKEDAFAAKFGCSNLKEFIDTVRKVFKDNQQDLQALQQFSSTNLRSHLEQFKTANAAMFIGQNVSLKFTTTQAKAQKIFDKSGGNSTIQWEMDGPDENIFNLEWDTGTIKQIVNKVSGKRYQYRTGGVDNIENMINYLTSEANNLIEVRVGPGKDTINEFIVKNTFSPFGLKPKDFQALAKNNPELADQLGSRIKNFILDELCMGASDTFRDVALNALNQKIGGDPANWAYFMSGQNWVTGAVGSLGELQAAIMFEYVARKTPNRAFAEKILEILGDQHNSYGEQFRSDMELFEAFGIQIKNYSGATNLQTGEERTIVVSLHPMSVPSLGDGVVDYMLNSYFNTSLSPYGDAELNEFYETHADEILNLDFDVHIPDKVSFYLVGMNLIPGSAILRAAYLEFTIKAETTIQSGYNGNDDYGYNPWMSGNSNFHEQPFTEWWEGIPPIAGNFIPTGSNSLDVVDRMITIKTKFTYSALFDGTYSLF